MKKSKFTKEIVIFILQEYKSQTSVDVYAYNLAYFKSLGISSSRITALISRFNWKFNFHISKAFEAGDFVKAARLIEVANRELPDKRTYRCKQDDNPEYDGFFDNLFAADLAD